MKQVIAGLALIGLAACNTRGDQESGRVGGSVDTTVTTRQMQDTTIITSDTTVRVDTVVRADTVKRKGEHPVKIDTAKAH